jgi:hypothetical protein
MSYVTDERRTDQCIKLYRQTATLLDAVFELPTWCDIEQWNCEVVSTAVMSCRNALDAVQKGVRDFGKDDDLDDSSRAAYLFAEAIVMDCRREIEFVQSELLLYANQ